MTSKKTRKSESSSGGGPTKKSRRESTRESARQGVTMTIPRKRDKSSSADTKLAISKIPKKQSSKSNVDKDSKKASTKGLRSSASQSKHGAASAAQEGDVNSSNSNSNSHGNSHGNNSNGNNNNGNGSTSSNNGNNNNKASKIASAAETKSASKKTGSTRSGRKSIPKNAAADPSSKDVAPSAAQAPAPAKNAKPASNKKERKITKKVGTTKADASDATSASTIAATATSAATATTALPTASAPMAEAPKGKATHNGIPVQDNHPYARGSVIEVRHGEQEQEDDDWWSEDSEDESKASTNKSSVRLCDVIDRVPVGTDEWRYYVHYRDFNRRMDEWIAMERIISPPSVGNAKARAIKKEEEREKRKQQRLLEKKAETSVDISAPRASRRRSSVVTGVIPGGTAAAAAAAASADAAQTTTGAANPKAAASAGTAPQQQSSQEAPEAEAPRRTRLQRRKSFHDDDNNTVVASNQDPGGNDKTKPPPAIIAAEKGVVSISTTAATTTTVGEHVVATVPAQELDEHEGLDEASLREHEEVTKVKNVAFLELGAYQMETWYFSPIPKELVSEKGYIEVLYVCEFTLSMFARKSELRRFHSRLPPHRRHPPGNEIYRNGKVAMFEVDGFEERIYCQNLCYIAKLFLDHKTLYFDVDPFLFYVLCEVDSRGFHPVGYFSKEKYSDVGYNLACILTFPSHQRKGYGRFLIAFSYELSKKEERVGSPEKPMSDLGQQAYKPYWASTIIDFLLNQSTESSLSIMDISKRTSIMAEDIVFTLNQLGILKIISGIYFIAAEENMLRKLAKKYPVKNPRVDASKLHWAPFMTDVKRDKFSIYSKKPTVDKTNGGGDEKKVP